MKVITLSKKALEKLKQVELGHEITNTEGQMFDFEYRGQKKVIKSLFHQEGERFANKLYTLEMLDTNKGYLPHSFCIPDSLISASGHIIGFTIPRIEGINLVQVLRDKKIRPNEQIYYLKKIGSMLEQLHNIRKFTPLNNIFINDLHECNFIVNPNNRELYTIDLDSCKIGNNLTFTSRYLSPFSIISDVPKYSIDHTGGEGYLEPDENTDIYCYIMVILNYLFGRNVSSFPIEEFYNYLNYLESVGVDRELIEIFEKVLVAAPNENPVNYLDRLTDTEIYRAREIVYEQAKSKVLHK